MNVAICDRYVVRIAEVRPTLMTLSSPLGLMRFSGHGCDRHSPTEEAEALRNQCLLGS